MDIARLKEKLEEMNDPRRQWGNIRHKLEDILVIGLVTLVCNGQDFEDMEVFGLEREAELRKFLELPGGIPGASTFFRALKRVKPAELSRYLYERLAEARELKGTLINVDGKTIRGSGDWEKKPVHAASARAGEEEIALGQVAIDEKSNEITAIPKLLDLLDVKGSVVTIDAMGCRRAIAEKIREKGADYALSVKENRPALYGDIKEYFEGLETGKIRELPEDIYKTGEERGHGRIESREARTVTDIGRLEGKKAWKDLKTITEYRCRRTENGETTVTNRYYISSAETGAEEFYRCLRGRWSIENRLHWSLDVIFREDAARTGRDHAPENLNILRKMALALLRAAPNPRQSVKKKMTGPKRRFTASVNPDYMFAVIFKK
jgi:predicted transposase YbfD/YdcC